MAIERGTQVEVTTAMGKTVKMRALGGPERGHDFPVVWVCMEEEYERSQRAVDEPDGIPWPVSAVKIPEPV